MTVELERAKAGDERAFATLVEPFRRELQLHCYRLLGSVQDAVSTRFVQKHDSLSQVVWRCVRAKPLARQGQHGKALRLAHNAIGRAESTPAHDRAAR